MRIQMAYGILGVICLAAVAGAAYVIYDIISISNAIANQQAVIPFDSGSAYLLLISVTWPCMYIELSSRIRGITSITKNSTKVIVIWFLATILLANVIPWYLKYEFSRNGYLACKDPAEISRLARGESIIYKKVP